MSMDRIEEDGVRDVIPVGTWTDNRLDKRTERQEQLLPGIPNEIPFKEIATKLPWREFYVLACVSRAWHEAIRNRQVYDARVRSCVIENFVIIETVNDRDGGQGRSCLVLCCLRDNSWLELPPVPHFREGYHWSSWIVVDGKIYVLGCISDPDDPFDFMLSMSDSAGHIDMVFMLDLAGHKPWTQCASMLKPRRSFGCGSMDGKIYAFGGSNMMEYSCAAEVFDPKENRWSLITPVPVSGFLRQVVALGEELVVYSGRVVRHITEPVWMMYHPVTDGISSTESEGAGLLKIYHPVKDEWRMVSDPFLPFQSPFRMPQNSIFVAQGKLLSMNHSGIYAPSFDGNSYTELYSNSFATIMEEDTKYVDSLRFEPFSTLVVDDELFARGYLNKRLRRRNAAGGRNSKHCLLRSRGFGSEKKEMAWREERDWPCKGCKGLMHAIQL